MMNLDELLQLQVLKLKAVQSGRVPGELMDRLLDDPEGSPVVRNMCAKVSPQLYDELEKVCSLLSMTKREFIEAAVSEAILRAHRLVDEHDAVGQGEL